MDIPKEIMEKVAIASSEKVSENVTAICLTPNGNVMASRGSVIPLFLRQIKEENRKTVTGAKMTGFLMWLTDAVELSAVHLCLPSTFLEK